MRASRLLAVLARWTGRRRRSRHRTTDAVVPLAEAITGGPNDPGATVAGFLALACWQLHEARQAVIQAQSVPPDQLAATHEEVDRLVAAVLEVLGPVMDLHERMPDARRCDRDQPMGVVLPLFREGRS